MNQLLVSGNAVKDAGIRATKKGVKVVSLTIADNYKSSNGTELTSFKAIDIFGDFNTEKASQIKKGDYVVAQGRMTEPDGKLGNDGRIFCNYQIAVSDLNLHSFINFKHKADTAVNAPE